MIFLGAALAAAAAPLCLLLVMLRTPPQGPSRRLGHQSWISASGELQLGAARALRKVARCGLKAAYCVFPVHAGSHSCALLCTGVTCRLMSLTVGDALCVAGAAARVSGGCVFWSGGVGKADSSLFGPSQSNVVFN